MRTKSSRTRCVYWEVSLWSGAIPYSSGCMWGFVPTMLFFVLGDSFCILLACIVRYSVRQLSLYFFLVGGLVALLPNLPTRLRIRSLCPTSAAALLGGSVLPGSEFPRTNLAPALYRGTNSSSSDVELACAMCSWTWQLLPFVAGNAFTQASRRSTTKFASQRRRQPQERIAWTTTSTRRASQIYLGPVIWTFCQPPWVSTRLGELERFEHIGLHRSLESCSSAGVVCRCCAA